MKIELGTKLTCTFNYLLLKPQSGGKVLHYKHYKNYKNNFLKKKKFLKKAAVNLL